MYFVVAAGRVWFCSSNKQELDAFVQYILDGSIKPGAFRVYYATESGSQPLPEYAETVGIEKRNFQERVIGD